MRLAGRDADLGMPEPSADHGQALAERERPRGVGVSETTQGVESRDAIKQLYTVD